LPLPENPYLINFINNGDDTEGFISSTQYASNIPFEIKRVFWTYGTPENVVRGRHAHRLTNQVLVAINGKIEIVVDNGQGGNKLFLLNTPQTGLVLPSMHWTEIRIAAGAVLLSIASTDFEESDYIREYSSFLTLVSGTIHS
jgi:hypothetical protein